MDEVISSNPDAIEPHFIRIAAPREVVYRTLWTADLGKSILIKLLLGLRSLPEFIAHGFPASTQDRSITMQRLIGAGFGLLAENPGEEIVLGVRGRFWRPTGNVLSFQRAAFDGPVPPGVAHGVWNFAIADAPGGQVIVSTETRVTCGDQASRRKFRAYWLLVRPFSGLIRILMLRSLRESVAQTLGKL